MTTDLFASPELSAHEHVGFELGWDYAHYRLVPPAAYALEQSSLRNGLVAAQAAFGSRTLQATRHVEQWLRLRLHAWLRGRSVELFQVTPHYLQQIEVAWCPITRKPLTSDGPGAPASIDRVENDGGYAAGNLAVMSLAANHAKGSRGMRASFAMADDLQRDPQASTGLGANEWRRVAVLCSFVERLSHEEASELPMLVLPPNRLRLFNPAQGLQAFVSMQLLKPGWSQRISRLEELIPGTDARRAFQAFFHALLPRVLEAGRDLAAHQTRWAIEDAWNHGLVRTTWTRFARLLTPVQCTAIVERATARKLGALHVEQASDEQATEGWNLESRGYVIDGAPERVRPMRRGERIRGIRVATPVARPMTNLQAALPLH